MVNTELFLERGFEVIQAENLEPLVELRQRIFEKAQELTGHQAEDIEQFFNQFHRYEIRGTALNDIRLALIRYCTAQLDVSSAVFNAFADTITGLIGPDIVSQKTVNLVVQQPDDPDVVPTHRDSPENSPFEIIIWLPLVDVYGTKSMYLLDREKTHIALDLIKEQETGYANFKRYAAQEGENLYVPWGSACLFWPGLVHGCHLNSETETRWALNHRYKNLFSPLGTKGLTEYFNMFRLSPLARMALEYEKETYA